MIEHLQTAYGSVHNNKPMIHTCNQCVDGWRSSAHRDGNSLSGEECGCEVYTCDNCNCDIEPDEYVDGLCNDCAADYDE